MNYLTALKPATAVFETAEKSYLLQRRVLKEHYILLQAAKKLNSGTAKERLQAMFDYIAVGAPDIDINSVHITELYRLLNLLIQLNNEIELLPWQSVYDEKNANKRISVDYESRKLALIVHTIASAYGWDQEYILNLQPEIAACYVQEIILENYHQERFEWALSTVTYDKDGKPKEYPKPAWYYEIIGPTKDEAKGKIPISALPGGVVIDPEKERLERVQEENQVSESKVNS